MIKTKMDGADKKKSDQHKVTFSVTIAKAFPNVEDDIKQVKGLVGLGGRRRVFEAPKPQHYFHLEYKLMPDDSETVKTDIVSYGVAAKIYMETDSKVLKTWKEGNKTWVAWTHNHRLNISRDVLLKMYNHTLELKIWDTKDRVSPRARFDRPKAFRLPGAGDETDDGSVRSQVLKQRVAFNNLQPKPSFVVEEAEINKKLSLKVGQTFDRKQDISTSSKQSESSRAVTAPSTFCSTSMSTGTPMTVGHQSVMHVQVRVDEQKTPQFNRLAQLAGVAPQNTEDNSNTEVEMPSRLSKVKADERSFTPRKRKSSKVAQPPDLEPISTSKPRRHPLGKLHSKREMAIAAASHVRSHGAATVSIKLVLFFSGMKTCTARLDKPTGLVQDLFLSVNLDKNLLSENQRKDLNPMVIQVNSASNMPSVPLSYSKLKNKCKPVFLEYQFYDQPRHTSLGRDHGSEVYWKDVNVVLLGTIDKEKLAECLRGPPLHIEVHDRNRKDENRKVKPSLFGEKPEDEMINNVALVAGRRTTHNPYQGRQKSWDPYGVAKYDLSGLLLGQKVLELRSAIHCCKIPDTNLGHESPGGGIVGQPRNIDGPDEKPMSSANYLEAGSELKIKVVLAYPINSQGEQINSSVPEDNTVAQESPFGRIVYVFDYTNSKFLRRIQSEITAINSEALELESLPQHVIDAALSTYKLSEDQRKSKTLDIITGFQVLDGQYHMFVLEGIARNGIQRLWKRLPRPPDSDNSKFTVLYNSEMVFCNRLYASLDVDLCRVRLHEPLNIIVQNPLLYVRDLVPRPCFESLNKLDKLLKVTKLREATRSDLFPTAEMVISMSREFGVPLTAEDFGELEFAGDVDEKQRRGVLIESKTTRPWTPIEAYNKRYEKILKERLNLTTAERNFIIENILRTNTASKDRPNTIAVDRSELFNQTAHNYSIQTLNSTDLAKEKLRQILAKEKDSRFTYCLKNNSAIVLPVEPEAVKKLEKLESITKWRSPEGFVFPGKKTSLHANIHPKKPDGARLDELQKPWKENVLHSNILKPTVNREIYSWPYRDKDFNLHVKDHDTTAIQSIHAAGDSKQEEIRQSQERQAETWRQKLVIDDPIFRTHRCLTDTELQVRGHRASNQIAKLEGLLKDRPNKVALKKPGITLGDIPPLSVVNNPSVDTLQRDAKVTASKEHVHGFNPGPFESEGWLLEKNKIPIRNPEHKKYEELKGQDFWLFHKERDVLYRREIKPLLPEERDNNLFAVADPCS